MPQIMPAKILDANPNQRLVPCLGVDLDDWLAVIGENISLVGSLQPLQDIHGGLIERHSVGATVLVL